MSISQRGGKILIYKGKKKDGKRREVQKGVMMKN